MSAETGEKKIVLPEQTGLAGWFAWVFKPGIGNGVIGFCRLCVISCLIFLTYMTLAHYTIHWFIMNILAGCLWASFEFFISELRKNPEIMDPANKKEPEPEKKEEEITKPKEE